MTEFIIWVTFSYVWEIFCFCFFLLRFSCQRNRDIRETQTDRIVFSAVGTEEFLWSFCGVVKDQLCCFVVVLRSGRNTVLSKTHSVRMNKSLILWVMYSFIQTRTELTLISPEKSNEVSFCFFCIVTLFSLLSYGKNLLHFGNISFTFKIKFWCVRFCEKMLQCKRVDGLTLFICNGFHLPVKSWFGICGFILILFFSWQVFCGLVWEKCTLVIGKLN